MKKYSTKAYYNYAKRMLEGEAALASTTELEPSTTTALVPTKKVEPIDSQFKQLIISAGTGAVGALACIKYLDKMFSISNIQQLGVVLGQKASDLGIASSSLGKVGDAIGSSVSIAIGAIGKAVRWVADYLKKIQITSDTNEMGQKILKPSFLGKGIGQSGYKYGTVLAIALAGAMVGMIIYKIYRLIKKMIKSKGTTENYYIKQIKQMTKSITESAIIMKRFSLLTEGDVALSSKAESIINKARPAVDDMWNWATKTPFHLMAAVITGFMAPIVNWILIVIAICKAGIVCWDNIKE